MHLTEQPHDLLASSSTPEAAAAVVVSITSPVLDTTSVPKIFSWSDMPCQGEDLMSTSSSSSSFESLDYSDDSSQEDDDEQDVPPAPPLDDAAITGSPRSCIQHDLNVYDAAAKSRSAALRRVSFEPVLHVRTYDVILGDHPCCVGGMALECAWEHAEDEELVDLELAEGHSAKRRMGQLQLNYSQRRQRLQATTGLTSCQLLQEEFKIRAARKPVSMMRKAPTLQQLKEAVDDA